MQIVGTALAAVRENTKFNSQFVGDDAHIVPKSTQTYDKFQRNAEDGVPYPERYFHGVTRRGLRPRRPLRITPKNRIVFPAACGQATLRRITYRLLRFNN